MIYSNSRKYCALLLSIVLLIETLTPTVIFAIGGGPTQPEFERFSPMADPDMVDLFTGDVKYNIPLMEVGGYPINLAYKGGSGMDEDATWVGYGWNINVGAINRNLRGLPDDFKGDLITKDFHIKENETWGVNLGGNIQIAGIPKPMTLGIGGSFGIFKNNYTGYGLTLACNPSIGTSIGGSGSLTAGLGLEFNSQEGMSANATIGAKTNEENANSLSGSVGVGYNSRQGLKSITYDLSYQRNTYSCQYGADEQLNGGISGGISLAAANYNPSIQFPFHNYSFALSGTVGAEATVLHPSLQLSGFYSKQEYKIPTLYVPAYGYIYSQAATSRSTLTDFLREKDGAYTKGIPCLPFPTFTYDQFNATGEGMSGQFRPFRSDVGILHDNLMATTSESGSAGIEIGIGYNAHGGGNGGYTEVVTTAGKWANDNDMVNYGDFMTSRPYVEFENCYFKQAGDLVPYTNDIQTKLLDNSPIRVRLKHKVDFAEGNFDAFTPSGIQLPTLTLPSKLHKAYREPRNASFSFLTALEAGANGVNKEINSYNANTIYIEGCTDTVLFGNNGITKTPRTSKPLHHISEITILDKQGKRYVYGLPAYTRFQRDVSFSVSEQPTEPIDGIVTYDLNDNSFLNNKGNDNYFTKENKPAFANTFLITEVLSANYVDPTGDGVTMDDYGDAVKFNYTKVNSDYKYRSPYDSSSAYYNGGLNSGNGAYPKIGDAKASYVWGSKELWYLHSIESKTHVAIFIIKSREDGLGVLGSNGGKDPNAKLRLLQEIRLFAKSEYKKLGIQAVPEKIVHFVYDYSICPGIPNNTDNIIDNSAETFPYYLPSNTINSTGGKLTLKKVYFTYGTNQRGRLNPYSFNYKTDVFGESVNYGMKNVDRWGTYKQNNEVSTSHDHYGKVGTILNSEYPYTVQDSTYSNEFSRLWNLTDIDLPSGAKINIEYEADDYYFVQNKVAHQMYFIEGFSNSDAATSYTSNIYNNDGSSNNYIFIRVPDQTGATPEILKNKFLNFVGEIFFRVSIDLGNKNKYDFINGYAEIDRNASQYIGISASDPNVIWIKLKEIDQANTIAVQAWQFMRANAQELIYPGSEANASIEDAIRGLVGSISEIVGIFTEFRNRAMNKKLAKTIDTSKSWVRLSNSTGAKLGGGHRVKQINVTDNWEGMTGSSSNKSITYSTNYHYKKMFGAIEISSGVASYEPGIGQEENAMKNPIHYKLKRGLGPDDYLYLEEPFGELLYPGASVGYSQVTVTKSKNNLITRTGTGKQVKEYYTAFDFPVVSKRTPLDPDHRKKPAPSLNFIYSRIREYQAVTQGYQIELNDMHGKLKTEKTIDEFGKVITSKTYLYKQTKNNDGLNVLDCSSKVVNGQGVVKSQTLGMDTEVWLDMREEITQTNGETVTGNTEFFVITAVVPIPILIPPIIPTFVDNEVRFRSAVTVKCISRYGILEEVISTKDGSQISDINELRDAETGEVVLTQTTNEFNDSLYSLSVPAHWAYERMGPAYKNIGLTLYDVSKIVNGKIIWPTGNPNDYIQPGDQLEIYANGVVLKQKLWASENSTGDIRVINRKGELFSIDMPLIPVNVKIIRSARKNLSSIPIESMTAINTSPYNDSIGSLILDSLDILNAEAYEYKDEWKVDCGSLKIFKCDEVLNPEFCLWTFLDSLISKTDTMDFPLFSNSSLEDSISVVDILGIGHSCLDSVPMASPIPLDEIYFHPVSPPLLTNFSHHFEWQLGSGCWLTITANDILPLDLANLSIIGDTENGCLKVESTLSDPLGHIIGTATGTACFTCSICESNCGKIKEKSVVNPYLINLKNNWNKVKDYKYYTRRNALAFASSNMKTEGEFNSHESFWKFTPEKMSNVGIANKDWVNTNTTNRLNRNSVPLEEKDALERPTSILYGYQEDYPKAITSNANLKNTGNDNFEDYNYFKNCSKSCWEEYFSFISLLSDPEITIVDSIAHTGNYSLKIQAGNYCKNITELVHDKDTSYYTYNMDEQIAIKNACIVKFSPDTGDYLISAWVKELVPCDTNYTNGLIGLLVDSSGTLLAGQLYYPSGPVIEGWQRIEGTFNIPSGTTSFHIILSADHADVYFDDVRILPIESNMKSYVFNGVSQKLMAELDENNYATFYEYDEEGTLIRIKKETERGIITLKETRKFTRNQ